MTARITVDKAGRIVLPKTLRQELRIGPGSIILLESEGDQITLRPIRPKAQLKKERGVWVYQGQAPFSSISSLIDRERAKRLRELTTT
jgi:AbrB family looped-hinge helix DNA binding protein